MSGRVTRIAALGIIAILMCANPLTVWAAAGRQMKTYTDRENGFGLGFPKDYRLRKPGKGSYFVVESPEKDWFISGSDQAPEGGKGKLGLDRMRMKVDPLAEWRQMYDEVWRIQRDFLYDPGAHGLDLKATAARYRPYLAGLRHRNELNELFADSLIGVVVDDERRLKGVITKLDLVDILTSRVETPS